MEKVTKTYGPEFVLWLVLGALFIIPGASWPSTQEPLMQLESAVPTPSVTLVPAASRMRDALVRGPLPQRPLMWVSVP